MITAKWILVVVALHFSGQATIVEFDTLAACETAKQQLQADIDNEIAKVQDSMRKTNPNGNSFYNPRPKAYCFQK